MADNMALMLLGIKDYDIEGIEDVFVGFLNDNKKNLRVNLTWLKPRASQPF